MTVQYNANDKLIKQIAEKLNMDKRVVNAICRHPYEFTASVFRDKEDLRPIRFRYLGILAIMNNKKKK